MDNFTDHLKTELLANFDIKTVSCMKSFLTIAIKYSIKLNAVEDKNILLLTFDSAKTQDFFSKNFFKIFNQQLFTKNFGANNYNTIIPKNYYYILNQLELLDIENNVISGLPPEMISGSTDVLLTAFKTAILLKGNLNLPKNQISFFMSFNNVLDSMAISGISKKLGIECFLKSDEKEKAKYFIKDNKNTFNMLQLVDAKNTCDKWNKERKAIESQQKALLSDKAISTK